MAKIDSYLRSIERFGATGATLVSGKSVTLHFPTGDRHATQVTSHELLVAMVREVAPANARAALDTGRTVRFALDSGGVRYGLLVTPHGAEWQLVIEAPPAEPTAEPASFAAPSEPARSVPPVVVAEPERVGELASALAIERTQYDEGASDAAAPVQALLGRLISWARAQRASELRLSAGAPAMARIDRAWASAGEQPLDGDVLARELGVLAPAGARASWLERGEGWFVIADDTGRMRVTLGRDLAGPRAAIRFLRAEAPACEALGVPDVARGLLRGRGLVVVAGAPGSGKSTTLSALVRELGLGLGVPVCSLEEPIELAQRTSALVSQREIGVHVESFAAGLRSAMRDGTHAIALGRCDDEDSVAALGRALDAGHLVLVEVAATSSATALARLLGCTSSSSRARQAIAEHLRVVLFQTLCTRRDRGQVAAYEVVPGGAELTRVVLEEHWDALAEVVARQHGAGAISLEDAVAAARAI